MSINTIQECFSPFDCATDIDGRELRGLSGTLADTSPEMFGDFIKKCWGNVIEGVGILQFLQEFPQYNQLNAFPIL